MQRMAIGLTYKDEINRMVKQKVMVMVQCSMVCSVTVSAVSTQFNPHLEKEMLFPLN